jgi:hypothetical protein
MQARQGDVLLDNVESIPSAAIPVPASHRGYVLAEGEATGHAHVLCAETDTEVTTLEEALFIRVGKPVTVRHEEHGPILLPEGIYELAEQVEYTPQAIRRVMD